MSSQNKTSTKAADIKVEEPTPKRRDEEDSKQGSDFDGEAVSPSRGLGERYHTSDRMPVGSKSKSGWYELKPWGKLPDKRSYHGAVIYDGYIYIHGGKDIKEGFYDDMWRLRLSDFKEQDLDEQELEAAERGDILVWESVDMHGDLPGKIAYHTSVMQS